MLLMHGNIIVAVQRKVYLVQLQYFLIQEEDKTNYIGDLRLFLTGLFLDYIVIPLTLF
jgi:hypothetical protein